MDPEDMPDADRSSPLNPPRVQERAKEEQKQKQARHCRFPPINAPQTQLTGRAEPDQITHNDERRRLEEECFLAELARIEQELRENLHREQDRQEALDLVRQEENRDRWRSLCYISLNQRVNKPWVFSFYRNFPMHIYCLPIQAPNHRSKRKKNFRR